MKKLIVLFWCCSVSMTFGQEIDAKSVPKLNPEPSKIVDSLYREDQFYVGFTYNLLFNRPENVSQSGFSIGVHLGFTRDMPINKRRNLAIGLGLGYSINMYNQNLFIGEEEGTEQSVFLILDDENFDTNRFTTHLLEAPLEFRWRTSTPESHKFYRIYTGFRIGYLYHFNTNFKQPDLQIRQTKVNELNRWQVGATFTFGWNTFNFHFYYSLNSLFTDDAQVAGETIALNPAKIGLIFYIL
ncbi:PorT family protein [Aquimarina sp. U1-2]|uniref:porin family protein n=1 Tax=Aquimarina sp. U1-2 TaxID=2823141 RepID=UPI001AED0DBA|nr:porin family protein [Aquimarina sp. U1-2]MBP2832565.1 PorT family protein [Aquimarina sp. U1-2]